MSGELLAKALACILMAEQWNGTDGEYIGKYQISEIYVRDVNRILGREEYTYLDRHDPVKSRKMVITYLRHYGRAKRLGRDPLVEDLVKIHAAGPDGWKQETALKYWNKGKVAMQ